MDQTDLSHGVNAGAILRFMREFDAICGENHAMIITVEGDRVFEQYAAPYTADDPHNMFSVTKCLVSLAVGFAIDEGLIRLDEPILPHFLDYPHRDDPRWQDMTVKALLTMHSNKRFSFLQDMTADHAALFMAAPFRRKEGFLYSNNDSHMLSALVTRVSGQSLDDYLDSRLFAPLGIAKPFWEKNKAGVCVGGSGVFLTARQLATIAECVAAGGVWQGKQVIPASYLQAATARQIQPSATYHADGFGYYFWQDGDTYRLEGLFGQFAVVIPAHHAVVTILSMHPSDNLIAKTVQEQLIAHLFDAPSAGDIDALRDYLRERDGRNTPQAAPRNREMEAQVNGKVYRRKGLTTALTHAMTKFHNGLIPNAVHSSYPDRPVDSFDRFRFDFGEDSVRIRWQENPCNIDFVAGMDGTARVSEVPLLQWRYRVWSHAHWEGRNLVVVTRPLNAVCTKVFRFRFGRRTLRVRTRCLPDFAVFCGYNSVAGGTFPSVPVLTPVLVGLLRGALAITKLPVRAAWDRDNAK